MGNRRDKPAADAFGGGEDYDLETVANALYGKNDHLIEQADRERVVRRQVALKEIYIDPNIQVRVEGLNSEHVVALAQVLFTGGQFRDPIRLFRDEESGRLYLSDGFHRVQAYKAALGWGGGAQGLEAEIFPGGFDAALQDAEEHNLQHGLKLSNQDKFNIFQRRLERDHEWAQTSNRLIAGLLGVDEGTVRNWRAKFFEGSKSRAENSAPQRTKVPEKRVGADGKSYPIRPPESRPKPKGVTPPAPQRYAHDPDVDQGVPEEEPSLTYDEFGVDHWRDLPQVADLHVPAVPDSYDADRETAIVVSANLEADALKLIDAAKKIQTTRGIRTFYKHDRERLEQIDRVLYDAIEEMWRAADHISDLRKKIEIIHQTGQPYEEGEANA